MMNRRKYLAIMVVVLGALVFFVSFSSFGQEKKGQKECDVGSETCKSCHPEFYDIMKRENPHWEAIFDPKIPSEQQGCEYCHGPGKKHAEAEGKGPILRFKEEVESAKARSDICLKCHAKQVTHFQFKRSVHKLKSCNDCHWMMGHRTTKKLLRKNEPDLCFSCHQDIKPKFYLPTRHKVLEGALKCSDCHTPHGTRNRASLRKWNKFNDDVCFKCHPEKRGPWVFEHLSVKVEGCSACHSPHGSPNRFLLTRRDARTLCLEGH